MKKILLTILYLSTIVSMDAESEYSLTSYINEKGDTIRFKNSALNFPAGTSFYRKMIDASSGDYQIWPESKLMTWALSHGFSLSSDSSSLNSSLFKRAAVFYPPGLFFNLEIPNNAMGEKDRFGWSLVLDMGFPKTANKSSFLSSRYDNYKNILRYEIEVDQVEMLQIENGYGVTNSSPVIIALPYARDETGIISVKIKLANHKANFGILYDAFLIRRQVK